MIAYHLRDDYYFAPEKGIWAIKKKRPSAADKRVSSYPLPKRIALRHIEGNQGFHYGTNYSTLEILFAPDYRLGHTLAMIDLRGHRFDNNTYAANVGLVARYIPKSFCELLGANVYYDFRQGKIGNFQQIGVGIEILGKRWDFRANGYIPISTKKRVRKCLFDDYTDGFFMMDRRTESISYGYNAEIGCLAVRTDTFLLYLAGGPYYITGRKCHEKTRGGEVRMRPQYKDYVALDLRLSHDPVFETVFQAQIIVSIPLYQITGQNKNHCGITDRQIYQPVERFEVMPIGKCRCVQANF